MSERTPVVTRIDELNPGPPGDDTPRRHHGTWIVLGLVLLCITVFTVLFLLGVGDASAGGGCGGG